MAVKHCGQTLLHCLFCTEQQRQHNLQKPVNSNKQTDVLGRETHGRQDQQHSDESRAGNAGSSNTRKGGGQTAKPNIKWE